MLKHPSCFAYHVQLGGVHPSFCISVVHQFLLPSSLASIQVPKETGGEDVNTVSAGMGRWLAAVRATVSRELNEPDS